MLSQAGSGRASPSRQPAAASADEAKHAIQDRLGGNGFNAGDSRFEIASQSLESLPMGDLPDEAGASRALPQEMAHELPVLSP